MNNLTKAASDEITIITWAVEDTGLLTITKTPTKPPTPLKSYQKVYLDWTVGDAIIGNNASSGFIGIQTPKGYFGVMPWFGGTVFKIGGDPKYYVCYGTGEPADDQFHYPENFYRWELPVDNPATGWTFPESVGYKVVIENTVTWPGIQMSVNIQDL
jgi:hypothetical protein